MPLFGHKRHRHVRTLSVRGPETRRAWLWGRLTNRSVMGRLGLCLLGVLMTLLAVFGWRVPFPYREGQRVANGIAAATAFQVRNDSETARLRANAREATPYIFRHDPLKLDAIPNNFRAALQDIEQAERLEDLEPGIRREFGLEETIVTAPDGFQGARERFDALKAAVSPKGEITAQARIEDLVHDFTNFIAPLRQTGVVSQTDAAQLGITSSSPIQIVRTEAVKPADAAAAPDPSARYRLPDVSLPSLLSDSGALGSKWTSNPSLTPIKPLVRYWLLRQNPVTLQYDQAATNDAKTAAEQAVPDEMMPFAIGDLLVNPGDVLQAEHLSLLGAEYDELQKQARWSDVLVRVAVVFVMLVALAVLNGSYLLRNEPNVIRSISRLIVYLVAIVAAVALGRLLSFDPWRAEVIPLVATVMIFAIAYNQVFAALTGFTLCLIVTLATTSQLSQFVVLMTTTATAVLPLTNMSSRTTLVKAGFVAGVAYLLVSLCVGVLNSQNTVELLSDVGMLKQSLKGAAWCLFAGYFVAGSLPFIESTFGVITDISLLEMSDPSHPLLQEMVRRAPGTYNHSISVASIGEAAADAIGANGLLVRVGAYFHDAGKMLKPQYFIENVQAGTESRHDHLAPAMSTLIIIGHVRDGVDLAEQYNLPRQLIDFIEQHHGTTLVEYFFHEATRQAELSTDHKFDAEESSFRYPGPKPQTKEAGVMMLADAVESASRTLRDPTAKRLETLVHDLTMKRLLDGQFDECQLTLSEIRTIEKSLVKSLIGIYHARIKYPESANCVNYEQGIGNRIRWLQSYSIPLADSHHGKPINGPTAPMRQATRPQREGTTPCDLDGTYMTDGLQDRPGPTVQPRVGPAPPPTAFRLALADEQEFVQVDADRLLEIAAAVLRDEHVPEADVSVALVDDASIHEINRRYLNHDYPTDVISFSLGDVVPPLDRSQPPGPVEGEIIISGETAARVAEERGLAPEAEVALYLVHGLLHLCGYDDGSAADRTAMRQRERTHLQKFGMRPNY